MVTMTTSACHHPTMHWCEEEGCAGAAVTALVASKKRLCVRTRVKQKVCACVQDKWISAIKQQRRHARAMCVRAAANHDRHPQPITAPHSQTEIDEPDN